MNPKVDWFFNKDTQWKKEYEQLRKICLDCDLVEELKWGCPCYTFEKKNIVLIHGFKEYCALLFFNGSLMKDPKKILIQQTENVQVARQIRFTNVQEIVKKKATLKAYIYEAAELRETGVKATYKQTSEFKMPEEFETRLKKSAALKKAFYALTPGRQRGYLLYFSSAKQAKTRESRVEKYVDQILEGRGLED
jgi:uncharacterized protein YdeI (YjbR/CyaY-like superfamily)